MKARSEVQFPMRCIWVHPRTKERAVGEFVQRCHRRREKQKADGILELEPEMVTLLGPPAAGKSSISRLPPDEVPQEIRGTAASLPYREEVNNDNLTDCMPGFPIEFQKTFAKKTTPSSESQSRVPKRRPSLNEWLHHQGEAKEDRKEDVSWAMQWLVYLMFHHGPVRDSIAWDVIRITIIDADELSVYYSSVMAGGSVLRAMHMLELAHKVDAPVPHRHLRTVLFWPWASQEQREHRQKSRHDAEVQQGALLGGNADANLVNLHYHAEQAEHNILTMLYRMGDTQSETESSLFPLAGIKAIDYLLIVDNNAAAPRVLLTCSVEMNLSATFSGTKTSQRKPTVSFGQDWDNVFVCDFQEAAKEMDQVCFTLPDTFGSLKSKILKIVQFFSVGDPLLQWPGRVLKTLDTLMELDEAAFARVRQGPAVACDYTNTHFQDCKTPISSMLQELTYENAEILKGAISELRKFCLVAAVQRMERLCQNWHHPLRAMLSLVS
jgi:hypothetical protein